MGIWDEHLKEHKIEIKMNHCNRLQQPGLDAETVLHWGLPTAKLVLARRTPCDPWMFGMWLWIFQCGPGSDAKDLGKATGLVDSGMGLFEYLPQAEEWFDPVQHLVWLFWHLIMWKYWDIPKALHGNFLSWNCNHLLKLLRKIYHKGCTTKVPYLLSLRNRWISEILWGERFNQCSFFEAWMLALPLKRGCISGFLSAMSSQKISQEPRSWC